MPKFISLRTRLLGPLIVLALVISIGGAAGTYWYSRHQLIKELALRGQIISNAIIEAAETTTTRTDFDRFVLAMAAEPGVKSLLVLDANLQQVIAGNHTAWDAKRRNESIKLANQALSTHRSQIGFLSDAELVLAAPVLLVMNKGRDQLRSQQGLVIVHLNANAAQRLALQTTQVVILGIVLIIAGLIVAIIALLQRWVIAPSRHIVATINKQKQGAIAHTKLAPVDELGLIGGALDDLVDLQNAQQSALGLARDEAEVARLHAENASRAKSEFLSSMSHELRTPLNWILGNAQLLAMDSTLSPSQRKDVGEIERGGRHLLRLIDEVLNLAQIESGRLELTMEPMRASSVFEDCIKMVEKMAQEAHVEVIDVGGDGKDALISADPLRLKQVILNFVTNAIKYNRRLGSVKLSCTLHGQAVRLAVTDTGSGIQASKQSRLFFPFERLGFEGGNIQGTGIGLVTSKRIVESMAGVIGFESATGTGSSFWAEFPLSSSTSVGNKADQRAVTGISNEASHALPATLTRRLVLCIEDDDANQRLLEGIFAKRKNVELRWAPSAEIGIELARTEQPDLILMDIGLPEMDGNEATRVLKADPLTAHIPVVALTARARTLDKSRNEIAEFDDYITKPFDVSVFLRMLDKILAKA